MFRRFAFKVCAVSLAAATFLGFAETAWAQRPAGSVPHWILVDVSGSSPIWRQDFASRVGSYVRDQVQQLPMGTKVSIRTVGEYLGGSSSLSVDFDLNKRQNAGYVGDVLGRSLAGIPKSDKLPPQGSSHLIGGLDRYAGIIACQKSKAKVTMISDGIESAVVDPVSKKELRFKDIGVGLFPGCELTVIGVGMGADGGAPSEAATSAIRNAWRKWGAAAGFTQVTLISDL